MEEGPLSLGFYKGGREGMGWGREEDVKCKAEQRTMVNSQTTYLIFPRELWTVPLLAR